MNILKRAPLLIVLFWVSIQAQKKEYPYVFNPIQGMVAEDEKPFRNDLCLNGKWQFMPVYDTLSATLEKPKTFSWEEIPIKIPSPWNVNSFAEGDGGDFVTYPSYPKAWNNAKKGWMRKIVMLPENWKENTIMLHFEAIAGNAEVYINGIMVAKQLDIYFPLNIDVSDYLKEGENEIIVGVAKASLTDDPGEYGRRNYVAGSFWGQHIAGIWQDVFLLSEPKVAIKDVFIQPNVANNELVFEVTISNKTNKTVKLDVEIRIKEWLPKKEKGINDVPVASNQVGEEVLSFNSDSKAIIKANSEIKIKLVKKVNEKLKYWTPEAPNLYTANTALKRSKRKITDLKSERFGWRQFSIEGPQLVLNGEPITLKGDSWHFMGIPQMTRRYAYGWYKMLKDANANAVRLHAMPFPGFYLDVADEMGICVLDETAIWSSDGGPKMDSETYWESCEKHVENLVLRDRNHASVFGWSVCNETLPVAIHVFDAPESIVNRQVDEINNWVGIVKNLDPTRDWISGDGETMRKTNLPTVIGHYGGDNAMKDWASQNKPWGVGETGMAYYGTPQQVSKVNGSRAFESMQGRMEGLAIEAHNLISKQLDYKASYSSIFNLIWYGLQPLELGLKNTGQPSTLNDGIFFTFYEEGTPGVQPERLGPYSTTINPGYDNDLPLYKPWPLFEAVKAANAHEPFKIEYKQPVNSVSKLTGIKKKVRFFSAKKENNEIAERLKSIGIDFISSVQKPENTIIIIDGKHPITDPKLISKIKKLIKKGAITCFWEVSPNSIEALNTILPVKAALFPRKATSFNVKKDDDIAAGVTNENLYFTEITDDNALNYSIGGELLEKGEVIIEASNVDWSRWNYKPEYLKTAAITRSEREKKNGGAALVKYKNDKVTVYFNTIDFSKLGDASNGLLKQLFANLGANFSLHNKTSKNAVNKKGYLTRALVWGTMNAGDMDLAKMAAKEFIDESSVKPTLNTRTNNKFWELKEANAKNQFDFKALDLTGPGEDAVSFLSFWVYSPRSLVNLLAEPNMPKLDMKIGADDGFKIYLNSKSLFEDVEPGGLNEDEYGYDKIPLEKGWNHILIKSLQWGGDWKFMMRFTSNHAKFFKELKFRATR